MKKSIVWSIGITMVLLGYSTASQANKGVDPNGSWSRHNWGNSLLDFWYGVRVDDQGRRLNAHEGNELGHTIFKHGHGSTYKIARRCETDPAIRRKNSTTYRGFRYSEIASIRIKDVIQRNQKNINLYAKGRATKHKFYGKLRTGRTVFDASDSIGLDCKKFDKRHYLTYGFWLKHYVGPEVRYDYPFNVVDIKRKSSEKGGWFIFTSFPVLQGRL